MYKLEKDEGLIKSTNHILDRKGKPNLNFRVHEVLASDEENRFIITPTQALDVNRPKEKFVVRGDNEIESINKFVALVRNIEKTAEMFEDRKRETETAEDVL